MTISDILSQLRAAMAEAEKANKALESAKSALQPLEDAADSANNAVNSLIAQFQTMTGASPVPVKSTKGGAGKSRGPRPFSATAKAAATRLLNEHHDGGKKKAGAVDAALKRIADMAGEKSETVTEELKATVVKSADDIWAAAKK